MPGRSLLGRFAALSDSSISTTDRFLNFRLSVRSAGPHRCGSSNSCHRQSWSSPDRLEWLYHECRRRFCRLSGSESFSIATSDGGRYRTAVCPDDLIKERVIRAVWLQFEDEGGFVGILTASSFVPGVILCRRPVQSGAELLGGLQYLAG